MTQRLWWNTETIRNWAWNAWRYYSWRPRYRLTLTTSEATAYVNMHTLDVVCNPEYPYPPLQLQRQCRHLPADQREFQMAYLESLIAHEAGHTHHTGDLPAGLLGQLVNTIEDERMERRMALDFPNLRPLFIMAADVDAAHAISANGLGGDLIRGCLLHRFTWHHPTWRFTPDRADASQWPQVKTILEAAWMAPTYAEVIEAAQHILKLLGLSEQQPEREDLKPFLDGAGQQLKSKPGQRSVQPQPASGPDQSADKKQPGTADSSHTEGRVDQAAPDDQPQYPGAGMGCGTGNPPERPTPDQAPTPTAEELRAETEGHARLLASALKQKSAPDRVQSSRDRGRFRADRYLTGRERPFDQKTGQGRRGEPHLRLAVDISASMETQDRMTHARRMAFTCLRAAQLAGLPVLATAFDDRVQPLATLSTTPQTALNLTAALQPRGDTALSPALRQLWTPVLPGKSVTIILTDGALGNFDYAACQTLAEGHDGLIVPILLNTNEAVRHAYERTFGRCVMLTDPTLLTGHVVSFLKGQLRPHFA